MSSRDKFFERDVHHHARNDAKQDGVHSRRDHVAEHKPSDKGTNQFRHAGRCRPEKCFESGPCRIVDRHGDTNAFGDVVNGNGDSHTNTD